MLCGAGEVLTIPSRVQRISGRRTLPQRTPTDCSLYRPGGDLSIGQSPHSLESTSSQVFVSPSLAIVSGASLVNAARSGFKRLFWRGKRPRRSFAKMIDGNIAEFSVATFNLRGIMDRWAERRPVLEGCLSEIDADVLCFQECMTGEYGQDRELLGSSYHVFPCKAALFNLLSSGSGWLQFYAKSMMSLLGFTPVQRIMLKLPEAIESFRERFRLQGSLFRVLRDLTIAPFFGNSVACRLVDAHEIAHSTLVLGDWRAAQRIEFELKSEEEGEDEEGRHAVPPSPTGAGAGPRFKIWIVNTHLDHEHPDNRERQALEVVEWMEPARKECAAVVLCGDFNGNPSEPFHQLLQSRGYRSGYRLRHGTEPVGTWPTGIDAPLKDEGPFECLDYVYVWAAQGYDMNVIDAQVYGDRPDPKDPTLFPSDHAAIKITLRLEKLEAPLEVWENDGVTKAELGPLPPRLTASM